MKRFSILGLMGLVGTVAVAIAALRYASDAWAGALLLVLGVLLGAAVLGVVYGRGRGRAGWLGFLVFGGGYGLVTVCPGLADQVAPRLPTSQLLNDVHARAANQTMALISWPYPMLVSTPSGTVRIDADTVFAPAAVDLGLPIITPAAASTAVPVPTGPAPAPGTAPPIQYIAPGPGGPSSGQWNVLGPGQLGLVPNRWQTLLPGAAHLESFTRVGHGLFALLAGALGAPLARRFFEAGRARGPASL